MKSPSEVLLFVLVITVENNLFLLFTIRKHAFPLMESDILLFQNSYHLAHFFSVLEVQEEAPFGIDEISCVLFGYKC